MYCDTLEFIEPMERSYDAPRGWVGRLVSFYVVDGTPDRRSGRAREEAIGIVTHQKSSDPVHPRMVGTVKFWRPESQGGIRDVLPRGSGDSWAIVSFTPDQVEDPSSISVGTQIEFTMCYDTSSGFVAKDVTHTGQFHVPTKTSAVAAPVAAHVSVVDSSSVVSVSVSASPSTSIGGGYAAAAAARAPETPTPVTSKRPIMTKPARKPARKQKQYHSKEPKKTGWVEGTVKSWDYETKTGWITPIDHTQDDWVARSSLTDGDCMVPGCRVTFVRKQNESKTMATSVYGDGVCYRPQAYASIVFVTTVPDIPTFTSSFRYGEEPRFKKKHWKHEYATADCGICFMTKKQYVEAAPCPVESRPSPMPVSIKTFGMTITTEDITSRSSWCKYAFTEHYDTFADVEDGAFVMFKIVAHRDRATDDHSSYTFTVSPTFGDQAFADEHPHDIIGRTISRWTDDATVDDIMEKVTTGMCGGSGSDVSGIENIYYTYWI